MPLVLQQFLQRQSLPRLWPQLPHTRSRVPFRVALALTAQAEFAMERVLAAIPQAHACKHGPDVKRERVKCLLISNDFREI